MRKSEPQCSTSNSPRRMSGANTLALSRSGRAWVPLRSHETVPAQPRTDLRNTYADARPHFAAQHSGGISIYGAPLLGLSPHCLPTGWPPLSTAPRSPSSQLVPLAERTQPPLGNATRFNYLIRLRRLLHDLTANSPSIQPDFIRPEDFPPQPRYLPRPLPLQENQLLQQELRRTDDPAANALLLIRATGIRIGECLDLSLDCLRQLESDRWALHVPLGKLHTERLVPADPELRQVVERILALRASAPPSHLAKSQGLLLPRGGRHTLSKTLRSALAQAAKRAGCAAHVTPHRLRHSFATEMLRSGVSLPALMQLLGHKDIRMTLRYVQVTQQDLQSANSIKPARMPPIRIVCPRLRSPKTSPSSVSPLSVRHWKQHVIFWKCTAVS
jgi:site-specific recombinase XerD